MKFDGDPVGCALFDFAENKSAENITVVSDLCDDDIFPVAFFFRTFDMMPELEQITLSLCEGKILDVGAGAGCHSILLKNEGYDVTSIDTSAGATALMQKAGLNAKQQTIFDITDETFDTIIILMNGIGLAGSIDQLSTFLIQLKKLLTPDGKIYTDSTDLSYLYKEDDGSFWIDLNGKYYGEMQFNMRYKNVESGWFPWLYIDFENLKDHANSVGLECSLIQEGDNNNYLVCLEHIK